MTATLSPPPALPMAPDSHVAANRAVHADAKKCLRCGCRTHGFNSKRQPNCADCASAGHGKSLKLVAYDKPSADQPPKPRTRRRL